MAEFRKVAQLSQLKPGEGTAVRVINNRWVGLIMEQNGEIYAFDDACPHARWSLVDGCIEDDTIRCPGHQWVYNYKTGEALFPEYVTDPMRLYKIRIEGDDIFVEM